MCWRRSPTLRGLEACDQSPSGDREGNRGVLERADLDKESKIGRRQACVVNDGGIGPNEHCKALTVSSPLIP